MIKLMPIEAVRASDYNPRKNDEKRLAITQMSLQKLGFLLPIYADKTGEILSGHQRHFVATRMGFRHIPVAYVDEADLNERKTLNVLFNRATNDLKKTDTCAKIKDRLYSKDIESITFNLWCPLTSVPVRSFTMSGTTRPNSSILAFNALYWKSVCVSLTLGL